MGFYFLVVLFLLNVLIALMSDALSKSRKEGEQAWRKQLSEALAEGEITLRLLKTLGQYRPIKNLLDILRERPSFHKRTKRTPTYLFYLVRAQNTDSLKKSDPPEK
ncbi:hypothetical protein DFQ27_000494 [Actinomortierella ambigua]|uniref:Ion transport domain-containing protein n=1 Tax=Actinomortierella ambigua TaxID=1343610 RepID=A0A9P6PNV9_9FUNG|nr:hypothetical protein DFQ27_000494 [Actinomortierella ambigua]